MKNQESVNIDKNHCYILGELWVSFRGDAEQNETWQKFFSWADIGLPLAYMISENLAAPTAETNHYIEETWKVFCEMISIDPNNSYKDLYECFMQSPHLSLPAE